jgi:hypothetical protein
MFFPVLAIITLVFALVCGGLIAYGFKHYMPREPLTWVLALASVSGDIVLFILGIQLFFVS